MISKITYSICTVFMLYACFFFYPKWNKWGGENAIGWDVSGYYWYLPSIFIYHDLKHQAFGDSIISKYSPTPSFEQSYVIGNGNRVNGYSCGMAVMYLPIFTIAHISAIVLGYPADGFSTPYQFCMQVGGLLLALIGLWYYRRLMLKFYDDRVVALLLLLLVFGTNYLNYSAIDGPQSHNYLFVIYVFLLLNTINFYHFPSYKYAARIGLLCGLAILARPSEMISVLIPLLWGMEGLSITAIRNKISFLLKQYRYLLLAAACVIAVGSIQVAYWLYIAGKPFVYSYVGKTFSWLHPHFLDYMFSFRSGWVTYTPMIFLVLLGIFPFLFRGKNKVAILVFFAINLYVVSAWDIWWYGGTGGRAMLHSYPIILFPLASLLQFMFEYKILKWILSPVLLVFTYFNLWFTYNAHAGQGLYDSDGGMTNQYFWHVVFRYHVPIEIYKLKDTNELFEGEPQNMRLLYKNNFESDSLFNPLLPILEGSRSLYIKGHSVTSEYCFNANVSGANWVRAQADFHCINKEWTGWKMTQMVVRLKSNGKVIKEKILRIHRYIDNNETKNLFLDVKLPNEQIDSVCILFWNDVSDQEIVVDNLTVSSFNE